MTEDFCLLSTKCPQATGRSRRVGGLVTYLLSRRFMCGHVTLQLSAVAEGVGAQRAGEALLGPLVSVFDVFLQRR